MELIIVQDRENKLRDQVAALEEQVARLESGGATLVTPVVSAPTVNGYKFVQPSRSESRASTVYHHSGSSTPTRTQLTPNGVWNSMHNPYRATGTHPRMLNGKGSSTPKHSTAGTRPPSPTASVASTAPTVDEDGWWS